MNRLFLIGWALVLPAAGCGQPDGPDASESVTNNEQVEGRGAGKDNWWDALPRAEWSAFERIQQEQDWFEVYRVADGVYAIYEPGQFEEVISFLIVGDERALLFDTGLGIGDMQRVVAGLTDRDVIVLNSHTHYDHIGGNYQFDTIYARDTAFTRRNAAGSSDEDVAEFVGEGWVWKPFPANFDPAEYRSRPFTITHTVGEGEIIDLGGRQLEVLATPGHAPDATCLIDRENGILFTGDTFYLAPLYTHLEGSDFDEYVETAGRLAALSTQVDAVMTAHNVPVTDPAYLVALGDAFAAIDDGSAGNFVVSDGYREYLFDGFSIIVKDEDQPAGR